MNYRWGDVAAQLQALLPLFATPSMALAEWTQVERVARAFMYAVPGAGMSGELPSGPERERLAGLLASLGGCLVDQEGSLGSVLRNATAAKDPGEISRLFVAQSAACIAVAGGVALLQHCQLSPAEAQPFLQCCDLPLRSTFVFNSGALAACTETLGRGQVEGVLLDHFMAARTACASAARGNYQTGSVAPQPLLAWLRHAADTIRSMAGREGSQTGAGAVVQRLRMHLVDIAGLLATSSSFRAHLTALMRDAELEAQLVVALLPAVHVAAVVLALPPERRPAGYTWPMVASLAGFFVAVLTSRDARSLLRSDGRGSSSRDPSPSLTAASISRALHAAAQLVKHMPHPRNSTATGGSAAAGSGSGELAQHAVWIVGLLGDLCDLQLDQQQRAEMAAGDERAPGGEQYNTGQAVRQAGLLLPLFSQLAALLQYLAATGDHLNPGLANSGARSMAALLSWNLREQVQEDSRQWEDRLRQQMLAPASSGASSSLPLDTWCRGTAAALRLLPPAAHAVENTSGEHAQAAVSLVVQVLELAENVSRAFMAASNGHTLSVNDLAGAVSAIWQLHSALCRAVHYTACGAADQLPCLASVEAAGSLLAALAQTMSAAAAMSTKQREGQTGSGGTGGGRASDAAAWLSIESALRAMAVAHLAALNTLLPTLSAASLAAKPMSFRSLSMSLRDMMVWGPAALAASLQSAQACSMLLGLVAQEHDPAVLAESLRTLLVHAAAPSHPSRLGTLLVSCGLLDELQRSLPHIAANAGVLSAASVLRLMSMMREEAKREAQVALRTADAAASEAGAGVAPATEEVGLAAAMSRCGMQLESVLGGGFSEIGRQPGAVAAWLAPLCPPAKAVADALLDWWRRPSLAEANQLELARAAAARGCAFLGCAELGGEESGPAFGERQGSLRCGVCKAVRYCGKTCSHADWAAGHRRVCKALAAERQQQAQLQGA